MLRLVLTLTLIFLTLPSPAHADVTGKPRVVDGDTIHIGKTKIRLHGIDAPEMKQTCRTSKGKEQMCGQLAKQALERLVKGQEVTCEGDKRDRYKRLIAVCYVGPLNINKQMVVDGWAMAYRKYSMDYVRAETFAKSRREGLWRGEFVPPWEWRQNR
ncbi:MAG TPA: thermonuclease family protein [Gammaproteobacteria bacterium]|jgi:endonuclease YncB( thermonuclease family)|nr:thermonuclease family protein [Gammaproteobacteria bacterium]